MPSAPKIPWACCTMPLVRGPTATRRARRSENDRIGDCARTMKNNGPAFINATMARSIGWANGASPFFARPIQFEAMKPNSISPACRRFAFSVLADLDSRSFDRNEFRLPLEYDLEGAALAVEGAVVFRGADSDCHIIGFAFNTAQRLDPRATPKLRPSPCSRYDDIAALSRIDSCRGVVQEPPNRGPAVAVSDALVLALHRIAAASPRWVSHAVLGPAGRFPSNSHGRTLTKKCCQCRGGRR